MSPGSPSSSSSSPPADTLLQPFPCLVCRKRFTRLENLKRHSALHVQRENDVSYPCLYCTTTFSRRDLRRRHIKRKHPTEPLPAAGDNELAEDVRPPQNGMSQIAGPSSSAGINTANSTSKEQESLGDLASFFGDNVLGSLGGGHMSIEEILSGNSTHSTFNSDGTAQNQPTHTFAPPPSVFDISNLSHPVIGPPSSTVADFSLSSYETTLGIELFFNKVAHCFPFIHRPTFDRFSIPETLLVGMLSLGLQFMDDQSYGSELGRSCFHRGRKLLETDHLKDRIAGGLELHAIQACMLLAMHAIMSTCGSGTAYGLRMHTRAVELARIGGLAEPLPNTSTSSDLESLWRQAIRVETHKRTFFALYQLDVMWYHILSIPRTISHLEIKHELPCTQTIWDATASSEWAHRSLTMGKETDEAPTRYIQAVRTIMNPGSQQCSSKYDAHGSLLIILFLLSSVREQSGWSTMTGRVSFERFEALHSSLRNLEGSMILLPSDQMSVICEATWHMSIIELLLWSPPHTNGVVEGSLDAALAAGTHLTVAQPIIMSGQVVESLERHLRFFLSYLDTTSPEIASCESPWVTIYCFKAALIAWQLIRAGVEDVTVSIGITDLASMYEWIRSVFATRQRWGVGRTVLNSLDELEAVSLS